MNYEMLGILFEAAASLYLKASLVATAVLLVRWYFVPLVVRMWRD